MGTKITISQEGSNPISITIPEGERSNEGIKSTLAIGNLTSILTNIGDSATGWVFGSISELKKSTEVKKFLNLVKKSAIESKGIVRSISQNELIKLDPKYFGKHNTWEIDGMTIARFNTTNLVGAMVKHYVYKIYVVMYDNVKKELLTKRFATIDSRKK